MKEKKQTQTKDKRKALVRISCLALAGVMVLSLLAGLILQVTAFVV